MFSTVLVGNIKRHLHRFIVIDTHTSLCLYCAAMSHSVASLKIKPILLCYAYSTVYDISLNMLPMADLSGSITPVWCEVCLKKGDTNKAHTYCTICTKCYCEKHCEVGFTYEIMQGGIQ